MTTPQQRQQEQQRERQAGAKDEARRAQQAQQEQQRWDEDADRKRQKYDEEPHWPDAPIEDIPAEEREALLKQAGPPGEMARVAWQRYQDEHRDRGDEPNAVMREQTRLQEMGAPVGENYGPVHDTDDAVRAEQHSAARQAMSPEQAVKTPIGQERVEHVPGQDQGNGESGSAQDRADAEAKAKKLSLEIRDYGAAGEWRVYDPATGRQVAKSRLDEAK